MSSEELELPPLLKVIEVYKSQKDVHNVFGIIMYTLADPFVIKVIRDSDFWNALDAISGAALADFRAAPTQGFR